MKLVQSTNSRRRSEYPPTLIAVLSGALWPSPLRRDLDVPALCLPLSGDLLLVDTWLGAISGVPGPKAVVFIVDSEVDAQLLRTVIAERPAGRITGADDIDVVVEPGRWRGAAGVLRDIADSRHVPRDGCVLACEAACLPPDTLDEVYQCWCEARRTRAAAAPSGMSCASDSGEPTGIHILSRTAIDAIPPIGYFDLKEQLIPSLYERGCPLLLARSVERAFRLRDRESYLEAVRYIAAAQSGGGRSVADSAHVAAGAHVVGPCVISDGARVNDGAIVHESVILHGARIGAGAVVSRCIIGPRASVPPGQTVRNEILCPSPTRAGQESKARSRKNVRGEDLIAQVQSLPSFGRKP